MSFALHVQNLLVAVKFKNVPVTVLHFRTVTGATKNLVAIFDSGDAHFLRQSWLLKGICLDHSILICKFRAYILHYLLLIIVLNLTLSLWNV